MANCTYDWNTLSLGPNTRCTLELEHPVLRTQNSLYLWPGTDCTLGLENDAHSAQNTFSIGTRESYT